MTVDQSAWFEVARAGPMTTVQDGGRAGHAHLGVPPSGALDRRAWQLANRLVGNRPGAAALETTVSGPTLILRAGRVHHIAIAGAPAPLLVGGQPAPLYAAVAVLPGQTIEVGQAAAGLRTYLAVSGGVLSESVFGSMSTDLLSGLGPKPLTAGSRLELGAPDPPASLVVAPVTRPADDASLDVVLGPRLDWLDPASGHQLCDTPWSVTADSNRIGIRLDGRPLRWRSTDQLPPEGLVTGSVQVPPDGRPVIFLNDHPVTGGYPVVAVLTDAALAVAAQLRPGSVVLFRAS